MVCPTQKILLVSVPPFLPFCVFQFLRIFLQISFSVVLLSTLYKCVGCPMHLYIMYSEKKPTYSFFSWMGAETSWLVLLIDARHFLCDPIKLSHSNLVVISVILQTHSSADIQKYVWSMEPKYSDLFRTKPSTLDLKDAPVLPIKAVKNTNVILTFWIF